MFNINETYSLFDNKHIIYHNTNLSNLSNLSNYSKIFNVSLLLNNHTNNSNHSNNHSNNHTNTTYYNNKDDDFRLYMGLIIVFSGFIILSCVLNYLFYECNVTDCLNNGFGFYPNKIKERVRECCLSTYYSITDYCYQYDDNDEYNEVYNIRDIIINIEVPNYNSNTNKISNYVYDETKLFPFKNEKCTICLDITKTEQVTTECNHIFCKGCIELYLENNNKCPNCRQEIKNLYYNLKYNL